MLHFIWWNGFSSELIAHWLNFIILFKLPRWFMFRNVGSVYELHTLIMRMNILRFIASNTFRFRIIMNLTIVNIDIGNTFYFIVHVHILFSYVHLCNIVCLDYLLFAEHMRILCAISTFNTPLSLTGTFSWFHGSAAKRTWTFNNHKEWKIFCLSAWMVFPIGFGSLYYTFGSYFSSLKQAQDVDINFLPSSLITIYCVYHDSSRKRELISISSL